MLQLADVAGPLPVDQQRGGIGGEFQALECGLQNGALAIAVVAALGLDPAYAVPAAIYSLVMFATALAFVALVRGGRGAVAARIV